MEADILLAAKALTKVFPGVKALDDVDFDLRKGEIHAILGENGAGKSTLIKIIGGVYKPDSGEVWVDGQKVTINSPREAQMLGIRVIHQELNLLPKLSVEENLFLGNLPGGRLPGFVNWKELRDRSTEILQKFQATIDPQAKAGTLTPGEQQLIEIAQALTSKVRILIMDEPSAALSEAETRVMFDLLKRMVQDGIGVIYITHRIPEIFEIADRVTVLRDGKRIETIPLGETTTPQLVQMMVGRSLKDMYPRNRVDPGEILLEVEDLCTEGLHQINLMIRAGEVLGVYGLMGSGRTQLANTIFGAGKVTSGRIAIEGKPVDISSPHRAKQFGLGYVPADRKAEALILPLSLRKNLTIGSIDKYLKSLIFIDETTERTSVAHWIRILDISATSQETSIGSLSGGNQQKVIFSRWLDTNAKILILNEPTRGVDVGAKVEIYKLIDNLCKEGHAILMFSSEMPELLAIADRIVVLSSGKITGEFTWEDATQEKLMECAIEGLKVARQT
ncbi:MAG: sugar ABC transporter ATP-binding protein [Chloroflexota bacterium]|nr:MAG: sugar ABC transporter ATP-binding protein [Chloroflexota bacterium]